MLALSLLLTCEGGREIRVADEEWIQYTLYSFAKGIGEDNSSRMKVA